MKVAVQTATSVHHLRRHRAATYTWQEMQETFDVSNAVAAELAGISDGVLDALRERLHCTVRLRGNQLTLEGDDAARRERARGDRRARRAGRGRPPDRRPHRRRGARHARGRARTCARSSTHVVWRHRGKKIAPKTVTQKRYVDAIRRSTVTFGIGPAGTGKTYLAMALAVAALHEREVVADHPHAPRGRGGRAARVPARRPDGEGRPVPAAALRRALRHARPRQARTT